MGPYLCLIGRRGGGSGGMCLFETGRLLIFFCLWDGRSFEVGANSKLGAYSNKYSPEGAHLSR